MYKKIIQRFEKKIKGSRDTTKKMIRIGNIQRNIETQMKVIRQGGRLKEMKEKV